MGVRTRVHVIAAVMIMGWRGHGGVVPGGGGSDGGWRIDKMADSAVARGTAREVTVSLVPQRVVVVVVGGVRGVVLTTDAWAMWVLKVKG